MASIGTDSGYNFKALAASANVKASDGLLGGIFVSAASGSPTITIYDDAGTGTTTTIVAQFTPAAGTWYPMPFAFSKGLNVVFGGTVSATVAWL
jgi:hypothetical protein